MRRTIRLTGRRQLPQSCVSVTVREVSGKQVLTCTIREPADFKGFPLNARLEVRLVENKQVELVDFGTIGNPKSAVDLQNQNFVDPRCQLRVAGVEEGERFGILLGSTRSWRLNSDQPEHMGGVRGLLNFLPGKIGPRTWKLDIAEDAHPIILVDSRIPDPRGWAKNDPVFIGTIMPAIIHQVFDDILCHESPEDTEWMNDWLRWADRIMPGETPPAEGSDAKERREWINALIDSFCAHHQLSDRIVEQLATKGGTHEV